MCRISSTVFSVFSTSHLLSCHILCEGDTKRLGLRTASERDHEHKAWLTLVCTSWQPDSRQTVMFECGDGERPLLQRFPSHCPINYSQVITWLANKTHSCVHTHAQIEPLWLKSRTQSATGITLTQIFT